MKKGHERDERHWEQKDKHNKKQVEKFQFQLFCVKTCIIYVVLRKFLRVGFAYLYFLQEVIIICTRHGNIFSYSSVADCAWCIVVGFPLRRGNRSCPAVDHALLLKSHPGSPMEGWEKLTAEGWAFRNEYFIRSVTMPA